MKRRKALSVLLVAALTTAAAGCGGGGGGGDASSATAVEMRVQRQAGTVTLSNDKGENVTLMEKMRLNAGHNLDTAKESYVMVSFDETKVMTLEENGSASVVQKGSTLQFDVKKGNAFVNLTEELKGDQAVEVRSGNMVCGMTGTSIQIGKDADGKDTILVTETDNPDGVSITVTDQNGNVTFHLDAKPGEKVVLQDDTGSVDKSNYDLEDLSVTSLYVIGQYPELVQKTAETFNVPADHISTLSKLVSTEGANAGPLNGAAAEVMEKALKETKGATGDALNAEQSILTNTRQLLDKVMAGQMTDEEKKNLINTANEQMNNVVKAALDAGVQGEDLNNIAKNVAESITNVASTAIDQGKSVTEITNETKTTGTNLGAVVTQNGNNAAAMAQAIEQIRNTTAPQPAAQQPQNPAPAQPQTPQAGNQNPQQQNTPAAVDDDDSGSGNGGNSGSGGNTTQPSSSAEQPTPPQPTPPQPTPPQPSTQEPSSTADQGDSGNTGDSGSTGTQEPTRTSGTMTPHSGDDYDYDVALSNNSTGTLFIDNNLETSILTITSTSSSTTTFVLPMNLTASDGTSVSISSVGQFNLRDMSGIRIESQLAEYDSYDIMPTLRQAGEDIIITTANATYKKEPGGDAVLTANLETTQQNFGLLKEIMGWQTDTWVTFGDLEAKEMSFFYNETEYCISTADNLQEQDGNMIINAYECINGGLGDSVTFTLTPQGTLIR